MSLIEGPSGSLLNSRYYNADGFECRDFIEPQGACCETIKRRGARRAAIAGYRFAAMCLAADRATLDEEQS